jgi:hypothetical protein
MNITSWLLWGFSATLVLTTLLAASQGLGFTRMNIPYLLGTWFTADRDRAPLYGFLMHLLNGWCFSLLYVVAMNAAHRHDWIFGAAIGLVHGAFVLAVALPALPGLHPRMASATHGPTVTRQLEPPGFLALNYGFSTPVSVILAHALYGAILGLMYAR